MKVSPIINSFGGGELSSLLDGRQDIEKYYSSCETLENLIILPQGGVRRRPGTYYVSTTKSNSIARLIPFQFSTTQSYILEFTDQLLRVYKDNGIVGNPYELATPYLEADLFDLQFAQDADMMFIVHPSYKPRELTRSAHDNWAIANYDPTADPFTSTDNYPSCVAIFEQRIFFANSNTDPQNVWASVSGDYDDMTTGVNAGDAFIYGIGSQEVNAVRWLSSGRVLLMGTLGGIFSMSSGSNLDPITPTNVTIKLETTYGSIGLVPKKIGNYVYFVQRNLKTLRETAYSYDNDEYKALNMTILASHITGDEIVDMAYQQSPYNILWCVRSDGQLCTLTREIDHGIIAWSRQIIGGTFSGGDAVVESVAVIPGDEADDEVWLVVKRTIDGNTVRYVEYLKPMDFGSDQEDAYFVDSGLAHDSPATITAITKAKPGVVTAASHGFSDNDIVVIRDVKGMTELNRNKYKVANKTTDTFELNDAGAAIDTYVKLLVHFDGSDGDTTFYDAVGTHTLTAVSSAQVDTAQSRFGGGAGLFNGSSDYITIPDHVDWNILNVDCSVDFWVRFNSVAGNYLPFVSQWVDATHHWYITWSLGNVLGLYAIDGTVKAHYNCSWTPVINTWYHIEITRSGSTCYIFIGGISQTVTEHTAFSTVSDFAAPLWIGHLKAPDTPYYLNGHIDELRLSKGTARHTADFTVEAEPYSLGEDVDTSDFGTYLSGGEARKCITTLSGLGHLEGETLDVFIDGIVEDTQVVSGAEITITEPTNGGGQVFAGLNYISTLKTMRIEAGSGQGTAQSKLKRVYKAFAMLYRSIGMNMGNDDTQNVVEFDAVDDYVTMYSGWKDIIMPSSWDRDGYIVITQDDPAPLSVISLVFYLSTSDV